MTTHLDDPMQPNTITAAPAQAAPMPPVAAPRPQGAPEDAQVQATPAAQQPAPPQLAPGQAVIVVDKVKATGLALCALVMVGCVAPWATLGPISRGGMDADGPIFLGGAIVAAVLIAATRLRVVVLVLGVLLAGSGVLDASDVASRGDGVFDVSIGWGLYAVIAGGVGLAIWALVNRKAPPKA